MKSRRIPAPYKVVGTTYDGVRVRRAIEKAQRSRVEIGFLE